MKRLLPLVGALLGTLLGAQAKALEETYTLTSTTPYVDLTLEPGTFDIIAHTDRSCQTITVDAYLILYDDAGTVRAQDDDGAHNGLTDCVASRLRFEVPGPGWRLRVTSCCGRPYGAIRLEMLSGAPTPPTTSETLPQATTAPETSTTESTTTTTTTVETTTTSTTSTSVPPETTTTRAIPEETTTTSTTPPTTEPPTTTTEPRPAPTAPSPPAETSTTTTTAASTTTPPPRTTSTTTTTEAPALPSLPTTSVEPPRTTELPQELTITDDTPIEELVELPVEELQALPLEVRQKFESAVNLYSGKFDSYVPTGSRVPIKERRTIIAATTMVAASTAVPVKRRG